MERFPLLASHLGALDALRAVVQEKATGAVVETRHGHSLVAWRDIAEAAARDRGRPIGQIHGLSVGRAAIASTIPASTVVGVEISTVHGYAAIEHKFSRIPLTVGAKPCPNLDDYACTCKNNDCPFDPDK
jgi:hypothetical protein